MRLVHVFYRCLQCFYRRSNSQCMLIKVVPKDEINASWLHFAVIDVYIDPRGRKYSDQHAVGVAANGLVAVYQQR